MENSNEHVVIPGSVNMSTSIDKLAKSLAIAQSQMGKAAKSSTNPFFKSKYADLTACLDSVLPHLNANEISLVQGNDFDPEHKLFFVTTMLIHSSGQWLKSKIYIPVTKLDAQGIGSASTYGRRYLVAAMCGLGQEDDDGNSISLGVKQGGAQMPKMATSPKVTAKPQKPRPATVGGNSVT